jgi:hypothetical protein
MCPIAFLMEEFLMPGKGKTRKIGRSAKTGRFMPVTEAQIDQRGGDAEEKEITDTISADEVAGREIKGMPGLPLLRMPWCRVSVPGTRRSCAET